MSVFYFSMMGYHPIYLYCFIVLVGCSIKKKVSDSLPVSHHLWDSLLQEHVSSEGWVDYNGFRRDSIQLNRYLNTLGRHHPNQENWSREAQIAYWINAYNAFTVSLVAENFPVRSIKDIRKGLSFVNSVWDIKFIEIEDRTYDLNNIEHKILRRQFDEPRIHFAINCASVSCPKLNNRAYKAEKLNEQLDQAAISFLNDPLRNRVSYNRLELSRIFSWFKGDFTENGMTLTEFVNQYIDPPISPDTKIDFLEYDWSLNGPRD
jgi:hypothetical protein